MNLTFVKIGKMWKVLRRDGFWNALRRIFVSLWKQYQPVPPGDVLIVTDGVGDSSLYRAHHHAEELNLNNIKASVATTANPFLLRHASTFSVYIFHRVFYSKKIAEFINRVKAGGKTIIFETDDLVYDSFYFHQTDAYKSMNILERRLYEKGLGAEIINDPYVKFATTTTSHLADKLKDKGKQVFIVPNKLSRSDMKIAEKILENKKIHNTSCPISNTVKIGYFSGTLSHNKDFATISDVLLKIMEQYPNVELVLAGPLDVDNVLRKYGNRIKQIPYSPRAKHFENIAGVDINLAPLEQGSPFCESKSELKFFEAGIVGVPTVAVRNRTFSEAIKDGVDGFLAGTSEEWLEKISKLVKSEDLRKRIGEAARQTVFEKYTTTGGKNLEYYNFLKSKIK